MWSTDGQWIYYVSEESLPKGERGELSPIGAGSASARSQAPANIFRRDAAGKSGTTSVNVTVRN